MLKKIAAAALVASLVPAVALACEGHDEAAAPQQAVKVEARAEQVVVAQKLDMKELQKMGNNAGSQIKKDAEKVNLEQKLDSSTNKSSTSSSSAVKKRPNAKTVSQPKAK